ncbi:MAG: iron ABC transporter permease [Chitinophagales bacterium]|nr:iron ABC transporter permease [Chitinophagales bacterium]MDW8419510.1 iron ABC transporter permease [Chitinophagales bacterium]
MNSHIPKYIVILILLVIVFFLQLFVGSVEIPFSEVMRVLAGKHTDAVNANIIIESRLPSAVASLVSGAALAVSGLMMQTMFRNPVAGPYVLGISSGAMLGVALLLLGAGVLGYSGIRTVPAGALVGAAATGALLVFLFTFFVSLYVRNTVSLLIIGLMTGSAISATVEILQYLSGSEALKNYIMWTFGSFRYVNNTQLVYLTTIVLAALTGTFFMSKPLNLLLLGDEYASAGGLNTQKAKTLIMLLTSILAGTVTAFCGPIGFVGLAVPHIARRLLGTANHLLLIPACILIGANVCGVANVVSVLPGSEKILPVNAMMNMLSAPVVIWIVLRQNKIYT